MEYFILSNNPSVRENFEECYFIDESVKEIFIRARNLVHKRHSLISHPLPASKKIMSSPFRSIIISTEKDAKINNFQVEVIENSIFKLNSHIQKKGIDYKNADDYQILDYKLLESALQNSNKIAL